MTLRALSATLLLLAANAAWAADAEAEVASETPPARAPVVVAPPDLADFCFIAGTPSDREFKVVRPVKAAKGTYGGVKEILPRLAAEAKRVGGDALIAYNGSQRFGFFPWRMVRPVVTGVSVRWAEPPTVDCAGLGGRTLAQILASDEPPARATHRPAEGASAPEGSEPAEDDKADKADKADEAEGS